MFKFCYAVVKRIDGESRHFDKGAMRNQNLYQWRGDRHRSWNGGWYKSILKFKHVGLLKAQFLGVLLLVSGSLLGLGHMFKGANCSFSGGVQRKGLIFLRRENGNVKSPLLAMISPNSPDPDSM